MMMINDDAAVKSLVETLKINRFVVVFKLVCGLQFISFSLVHESLHYNKMMT